MRNFTLTCACLIGFVLIVGGWWFPDNIIMWFASASNTMGKARLAILAGMVVMALLHSYYDSVYLRLLWGMASIGLMWGGTVYFIDNAEFIFDAMYIMLAGICFAIAALRPADEPISTPVPVNAVRSSLTMEYSSRHRKPRLQLTYVTLKSGPQLLKQ